MPGEAATRLSSDLPSESTQDQVLLRDYLRLADEEIAVRRRHRQDEPGWTGLVIWAYLPRHGLSEVFKTLTPFVLDDLLDSRAEYTHLKCGGAPWA